MELNEMETSADFEILFWFKVKSMRCELITFKKEAYVIGRKAMTMQCRVLNISRIKRAAGSL